MLPFGHSCKGSTIHCASIFWNHTRKQVKKHYTKNGQTVQIISANVANPLPVIFTLCPKNWVGTRNDGHAGCEQIASSVSVSLQLARNGLRLLRALRYAFLRLLCAQEPRYSVQCSGTYAPNNVIAYSKRHCECSAAEWPVPM